MVSGRLRVSAPFLSVVASKVDRLCVVRYTSRQRGEFTTWKSQLWRKLWLAQCHLSLMSHTAGKALFSLKVHHLLNISAWRRSSRSGRWKLLEKIQTCNKSKFAKQPLKNCNRDVAVCTAEMIWKELIAFLHHEMPPVVSSCDKKRANHIRPALFGTSVYIYTFSSLFQLCLLEAFCQGDLQSCPCKYVT